MKKILAFIFLLSNSIFAQKVHSHNDYVHQRPFWEAFEAGANSIEADVFLVDNQLFVAHDLKEVKPENTFTKLYLEPISKVLKNKKRQNLQILIDLKTPAETTLERLIEDLEKFPKLPRAHKRKKGKITFVISGNRPKPDEYSKYPEYIFFDHQSLDDLAEAPKEKIALVSFPFYKFSLWNGKAELPENDQKKLTEIIETVHKSGLPIRFWATPDTQLAWKTLSQLGVDFINTDKPKDCVNFFYQQ
ncbi:MAG: phosphatidylinositol-specific phospholipase C/glycerophosphodiester phosphodiesterase family protein [Spirosomataceae bacterium]